MINILFTCIGRRVSLLKSFRKAARRLRINASFIGSDMTPLSPALNLCDKKYIVKPIKHPDYLSELLRIVKQNKVKLLVPTIDTELLLLAENKTKFDKLGCRLLLSEPDVINTCQDKRKTYRFLSAKGFDTPVTMTIKKAISKKKMKWPCFLKPWDGYASRGNAIVKNREELLFFAKRIPNAICQELIVGTEHTCDVYVDFDMNVRSVVPRKRIEVRAGEVSIGQVVKNPRIMDATTKLVQQLGAGPGVITIQLFLTKDGGMKFVEINPRFGGGVPLSIKAGANYPKWILQELIGTKTKIRFGDFRDGLVMLRYDAEVWLKQ